MAVDLGTFLERLIEQDRIDAVMTNEFAQFGVQPRQYVGAFLLPEDTVQQNTFRETEVMYRTVVANAGTRYSPAQIKEGGVIGGEMLVELGNSDISTRLRGDRYDDLVRYLQEDASMATQEIMDWVNSLVNMALVEYNEIKRWEALENAQVTTEINGIEETVSYPDPTGNRVAASLDWTTDSNDPFEDILAMQSHLRDKGYTVENIITSHQVMSTLRRNEQVARRAGAVVGQADNTIQVQNLDNEDVTGVFQQNSLPTPTVYDLNYFDEQGNSNRFMSDDVMVFTCRTDNEMEVRRSPDPTQRRILRNTLGYTAIGKAAGQPEPGRAIDLAHKTNKPPRIEADGWQTSLPVLQNPEAVGVINSITTA